MSSSSAASTVRALIEVKVWFRRGGSRGLLRFAAQHRGERPPAAHSHPNPAVSPQRPARSCSVARRITATLLAFWFAGVPPDASILRTR